MFSAPIRTVAPQELPVLLQELKRHCRINFSEEDIVLASYLRAAIEEVENYTGLGLITQTWKQSFPSFSSRMELHRRPLQLSGSPVVAATVEYLDSSGALQGLSGAVYNVSNIGSDRYSSVISLGSGQSWPSASTSSEAVVVTYVVGYGPTGGSVPTLIKHAIMMAAASWYGFREDVAIGMSVSGELPFASKALLRDWRPLAVA